MLNSSTRYSISAEGGAGMGGACGAIGRRRPCRDRARGGGASRGSARAIDAPSWRSRTPAASSAPSPPGRAWRRRFPEAPPSCAVSRARGCAATSRCFQRVVRSAAGSSSGRGRSLPALCYCAALGRSTLSVGSAPRHADRFGARGALGGAGRAMTSTRRGSRAGCGDDVHARSRSLAGAARLPARRGRPPPAPPESWWSRVDASGRALARSREPRRGRGAGEGGRVSREARPGRLLLAGVPPRVPVLPLVARRAPLVG